MKRFALAVIIGVVALSNGSLAKECGGVGYRGSDSKFCLQCHKACPTLHPVSEIEVKETECIRVPAEFPLKNGRMTCLTCHDTESKNRDFLRSTRPLVRRFDFCFQCHNEECYKKFNPHRTIESRTDWSRKKKACIYCHGVGATLEAYNACYGCHTKTPHVGAYEHLKADREKIEKLVRDKEEVFDIKSIKDLKPRVDERVLKKRKPKVILVKGRIECITCHNPHPQIAVVAPPQNEEWVRVEKIDLEYRLEKLKQTLKRYSLNTEQVKLMSADLRGGKLCQVCHSINSLK